MLIEFNRPQSQVDTTHEYFVIALELKENWLNTPKGQPQRTFHAFFRSDRYTCYGGNLQIDLDPRDAKRWKTREGATKALAALVQRGIIKDTHKAIVCRYTRSVTTTETFETQEAACPVVA